jgi:ankyrin repeat protein
MTSQQDIDSDISAAIERDDADQLKRIIDDNSLEAHVDLGGWLALAAQLGKLDSLKRLLECGANVNWQNDDGETAFSYACALDQFASARILYAHGADINGVHATGCTPLDIAVCRARPEFRAWLKSIGGTRNQIHEEWPWPIPDG